jgi:hypothetical protein
MRRKNHGATLARDAENDSNPGDRLMLGIIAKLIKKIFGSHQERALKVLWQRVQVINEWYEKFDSLSDDEIKAKTWEFRARLQQGETLDDILPEAFAAVKQACKRNVGQRWMAAGMPFEWVEIPYDVQLIGGMVLHLGNIAEMATGEGKTLVATLPLYLNALEGRGCHLATFNDMLAQRDSQWTGHILEWLGLTVGCIQQEMEPATRRAQYAADVTYGQSSEFGFDYLRDNMSTSPEHLVQGARSSISQALAEEIIARAREFEGARVIMNAFRTLLIEVPQDKAGGLLTEFGGRFFRSRNWWSTGRARNVRSNCRKCPNPPPRFRMPSRTVTSPRGLFASGSCSSSATTTSSSWTKWTRCSLTKRVRLSSSRGKSSARRTSSTRCVRWSRRWSTSRATW